MTYVLHDLVLRHLTPFDTRQITGLMAEALGDGPVGSWLCPDPVARRRITPGYFEIFVDHAVRHGEVYGTEDPDTGEMTSVALWFPLTGEVPPPVDYDQRVKEVTGSAFDRIRELDAALEARHPVEPHHYLAYLAVRPDVQNHGIGSALLDRHHARLDRAELPAYLEATHPRNRDLYLRHGYQVRSVIALPDGPPLWTMWRSPIP